MTITSLATLHTEIYQSVEMALTAAGISDQVQYENSDEPPTKGVPWARVNVVLGDAAQVGMGVPKTFRYAGSVVIRIFSPPRTGTQTALTAASAIDDYLRGNLLRGVQYLTPSIESGDDTPGWYVVSLQCPFYADRLV